MTAPDDPTFEGIDPNMVTVSDPLEYTPHVDQAIVQGIHKMLKNGRRYFGSSGASLTHQAFDKTVTGIKPELAKVGLDGERDTTIRLRDYMAEKLPNAVLIDSVHIKNEDGEEIEETESDKEYNEEFLEEEGYVDSRKDSDHILIVGNEVIIIDSKRWKKNKNYSVDDEGQILRSNRRFPGGNVHMGQAMYLWRDYLLPGTKFTGIVCVNNEGVSVFRNRNWYMRPYRLVSVNGTGMESLEGFLNLKMNEVSQENLTTINPSLVAQVAVCCIKPFDKLATIINMDAIKGLV